MVPPANAEVEQATVRAEIRISWVKVFIVGRATINVEISWVLEIIHTHHGKASSSAKVKSGKNNKVMALAGDLGYVQSVKKVSLFAALLACGSLWAAEEQKQPAPGTAAPDFKLATGDGSQVSLKDYRGKWVVLYFYPKDFTSGCTLEAKNFQRDLARYEAAEAVILGVSVDSAQSHKDFCAKEGLSFKLLADPDGKTSAQYGSAMEYQGAKMAARNTFLINPKGEVAKVYTGVKPAEHSDQLLKDLAELKKP
jgi:peroxiredoxin Q/BCP